MKFQYHQFGQTVQAKIFSLQLKENRRIGLREVANLSSVSAATISRAICGRKMDIDTILKLTQWMNIDIQHFIK